MAQERAENWKSLNTMAYENGLYIQVAIESDIRQLKITKEELDSVLKEYGEEIIQDLEKYLKIMKK